MTSILSQTVPDRRGSDYAALLPAGEYVVCAKTDDPLARPARARLIWAANTAAATAALGVRTLLVGNATGIPYKVESLAGMMAVKRRVQELYNVDTEFGVAFVNAKISAPHDDEKFPIPQDYTQSILPRAGLVHTRDPAVALACSRRKINYILEYHDEDYQKRFKRWSTLFSASSTCLALVAITEKVRSALIEEGVPAEKIIVLDSGVNEKGAVPQTATAEEWRKHLIGDHYCNLVVYSGGMQAERGIADVLQAADRMPRTLFVFCGGHTKDIEQWSTAADNLRLGNVRFFGYVPHGIVCELQQAADVLILSRAANERAAITSPLKFFEYLVSGTPIVSARLPATARIETQACAIDWYEAGQPDDLVAALGRSFERFQHMRGPHQENIEVGLRHSWRERQRQLFEFIGSPNVKTTF